MPEIIYSKFSNERDRRFAVRTDILEENGKRFVKKSAVYPEGKLHEQNLLRWYEELSKVYKEPAFSCNLCEKGTDGMFFEYVNGQTLEEVLDALLAAGQVKEAEEKLIEYASCILKMHEKEPFKMTEEFKMVFGESFEDDWRCAPITNIDVVCGNLVLAENPVIVDYEWTFDFPIPGLYVVYRIIHYYAQSHAHRESIHADAIYEAFHITEKDKAIFAEMERNFQNYICGKHVPMRDMYVDMTKGIRQLEPEREEALQVYFSFGQGFGEEHSMRISLKGNRVETKIRIPEHCTEIRLDPGDFACAVRMEKLTFGDRSVELSACVIPEGALFGDWFYIAKADPNICGIPVPEGAGELEIILQVFPENEDVLKNTVAQLLLMQQENQQLRQLLVPRTKKLLRKVKKLIGKDRKN